MLQNVEHLSNMSEKNVTTFCNMLNKCFEPHAAFPAFQGGNDQKLNARKVLLLAVLGHGDKARVLRAVMASMMVAVAKAQAWHPQLL